MSNFDQGTSARPIRYFLFSPTLLARSIVIFAHNFRNRLYFWSCTCLPSTPRPRSSRSAAIHSTKWQPPDQRTSGSIHTKSCFYQGFFSLENPTKVGTDQNFHPQSSCNFLPFKASLNTQYGQRKLATDRAAHMLLKACVCRSPTFGIQMPPPHSSLQSG